MNLPKIDNLAFIGIAFAAILIFFYLILGFSGMMSAFGIILLFVVPIYFILDNLELEQDEKIIFSFFLGIGIFPSIAYWLGMLISFRLAIGITFILLVAVGFAVRRYKNKQILKLN